MMSVKIEIFVTVVDLKEANEIGDDLRRILFKCGVTNKVTVTDEVSK